MRAFAECHGFRELRCPEDCIAIQWASFWGAEMINQIGFSGLGGAIVPFTIPKAVADRGIA